jgi:flavin reductase (DIM6/NTAB) family NADH-FMN oxidoreductase RutF
MTTADAFDAVMAQLDAPMAIVTTCSDTDRAGCLIGFHSQSGIAPSSLSLWLSKANHTFRVGCFAEVFAVHFLSIDDVALAELFGTVSGDDVDKFGRCRWHEGPDGVPLLDGCADVVVGRKAALLDTGTDHVCLVLDPIDATSGGRFTPLRLSDVAGLRAGHDVEERPEPADTTAGVSCGVDPSAPS